MKIRTLVIALLFANRAMSMDIYQIPIEPADYPKIVQYLNSNALAIKSQMGSFNGAYQCVAPWVEKVNKWGLPILFSNVALDKQAQTLSTYLKDQKNLGVAFQFAQESNSVQAWHEFYETTCRFIGHYVATRSCIKYEENKYSGPAWFELNHDIDPAKHSTLVMASMIISLKANAFQRQKINAIKGDQSNDHTTQQLPIRQNEARNATQ